MNEQEKNISTTNSDINNGQVSDKRLEEIADNLSAKIAKYEEYQQRQQEQKYSFGTGNFNFVTNNPLIARFFVYPFDIIILLAGIIIVATAPSVEKVVGVIFILVSIYVFIKFRERVKIAKAKREDIQSNV